MSLKNRQERNAQQQQGQVGTRQPGEWMSDTRTATPVQLVSGREYFAVVDGEILNVIGTTDIPGMSVAYWLQSDEDGTTAAVSHKEAPIFTTAQRALQFLNEQRGGIGSGKRQ
jgi:hypothetical protein